LNNRTIGFFLNINLIILFIMHFILKIFKEKTEVAFKLRQGHEFGRMDPMSDPN
jgi:hypothetical protein